MGSRDSRPDPLGVSPLDAPEVSRHPACIPAHAHAPSQPFPLMGEPSWSLHLLSELLSAFNLEDPDTLRHVIHRVGEAVDAEVVALVAPGHLIDGIGLAHKDMALLMAAGDHRPQQIQIPSGLLQCQWSPIDGSEQLVVGRLAQSFDLEERSLLRAMARSLAMGLQVLRSVEAERLARREAEEQAIHDALTGLPNRVHVIRHLERLLLQGDGAGCSVLFIDLDRFKIINDAHGHAMGDGLLIALAARLQQLAEPDHLVGRLGGDEFVVVVANSDPVAVEQLSQRLITRLMEPLVVQGRPLLSGASLGIATAAPGETAERLIENADMAMYRAKQQGRGRFCCYDLGMRLAAQRRASLEADLHLAIANREIACHLQPIVSLQAGRPLVGFEALARWHHPLHGTLAPQEFVPLAEESSLIVAIDALVLEQACCLLAGWIGQGLGDLQLSVNVSGRSFQDPDLAERVGAVLARTGMPVGNLFLEITETVLVDDIDVTMHAVKGLDQLGLRLAVDDFGTGYSSLRYLRRFPIAILKIDRSFVDGLGTDREDETIVRAVIGLARALGITVVAEGVETQLQDSHLISLGCARAQGFYYGGVLDPVAAEAWLRSMQLATEGSINCGVSSGLERCPPAGE
jgi:diguanylate cyclase (GGDEF)-like protein